MGVLICLREFGLVGIGAMFGGDVSIIFGGRAILAYYSAVCCAVCCLMCDTNLDP